MQPTEITDEHLAYWSNYENSHRATFLAPEDPPDCVPCPGLVTQTEDGPVVRVAWSITDEEIETLRHTKTLWLSTWGGLPAHSIEVQP